MRTPLPIDARLPEILAALGSSRALVLRAEPGTGKTTRVPPALLQAPWRGERDEIWVLEPRRLATRLAAARVAEEMGEELGGAVGYQFRFEKREGPRTRLRFLTEGIFLRKISENPSLQGVAAVVLDEFHERSLDTDLALGFLRRLQVGPRPDLRIVVMSATLDADLVDGYFKGEATHVRVPGERHPVEMRYLPGFKELGAGVERALEETTGDALVFLPGMAEIRRVEARLGSRLGCVRILHGDLERSEQDLALRTESERKIILATNIAESSVTIPGVRVVIDSGLARVARASAATGLTKLETRTISRASAEQRAGRAGRTGPGVCVRLYAKSEFETLRRFEAPEVRRVDLVPTVLALAQQGIRGLEDFPWIEAPSGDAWTQARRWLHGVGALSEAGACTELGEGLSRMPVHPRIGLFLKNAELGAEAWAARISEGELPEGELAWGQHFPAGSFAVKKLEERLRGPGGKEPGLRAILRAFWDRVGRVRGRSLPLAGGGEFKLRGDGHSEGDLLLVLDALETESGARLRSWIALEEEMLWDFAGGLLEERREIVWEESRARAEVRAELRFGALLLEGRLAAPEESDRSKLEARLLEEVLRRPERAFDLDALRARWARREFARRGLPPGEPPAEEWTQVLREMCAGATSFEELKARGLELSAEESRQAPETIALPGRSRVPVHYALDRDPWVESRLQDFFGLKDGPRVRGGASALTLHLLAPNGRALQVTRDLSGFWAREYPRIRQELCRRYPRHAWPEDPLRPPPPSSRKPR